MEGQKKKQDHIKTELRKSLPQKKGKKSKRPRSFDPERFDQFYSKIIEKEERRNQQISSDQQ